MVKVMEKDTVVVSLVVWLILVVYHLKLIYANMEGLWAHHPHLVNFRSIFDVLFCEMSFKCRNFSY